MHNLGLVGGTFDRLHAGHRILIEKALSECTSLEIWLTSDSIAQTKDSRCESWAVRGQKILDFLDNSANRVSLHVLEDSDGPAPWHQSATAIMCTPETRAGCDRINSERNRNGLSNLEVIVIEHLNAHDGNPISSSRIRSGEISTEGESWLPSGLGDFDFLMTKEVELNLKDPFGRLIEGPEENPEFAMRLVLEEIFGKPGPIIAVGDVTVKTLQDLNNVADIALIDERTKRELWAEAAEIDNSKYDIVLECENQAGILSKSLFECCKVAIDAWLNENKSTLIRVDGEEDLAPLLLHPLAPLGAVVLYGQPGKGVVIRYTGFDSKNRCRDLLSAMIQE